MLKAFVALSIITLLFSTTITGNIFNADTLGKMNNTLVTVEDVNGAILVQKFFHADYSLNIASGKYLVRAYHYFNGSLDYYAEYKIQVGQGAVNLDLVLLPYELIQSLPEPPEPPPLVNQSGVIFPPLANQDGVITPPDYFNSIQLDYFVMAVIFVLLLAYPFYHFVLPRLTSRKTQEAAESRKTETEIETKVGPEKQFALDEDSQNVLKILRENEGRMVQRDIRKILNFSETKMSLIIAELEACGLIKRIKKGRENIIKLLK